MPLFMPQERDMKGARAKRHSGIDAIHGAVHRVEHISTVNTAFMLAGAIEHRVPKELPLQWVVSFL